MSLGCAAGLLSSGAIGDDHGRRRTFLAGALLLAPASMLAALAPDAPVLVIARVVQGLGGAAMLACSLGLISDAFLPGPARNRATGVWGASLGAGVAIGPLLAVGLGDLGGWRLSYWATAGAAVALAAAGRVVLSESRVPRPRPVDVAGTVLLGFGLAGLLAGLVEGRTGWGRPATIVLLIAGALLVASFLVAEHCQSEPMFDLALLRRPDFAGATAAALAAGAGVLALMNFVPTLLALSVVTALAARWLPVWITPRAQLIAGLVGVAAGQLALAGLSAGSPLGRLLPGLLLAGAANGVLNAALGRQAVAMGSGATNTARYIGSAVGIAVCAVIVNRAGTTGTAGLVSNWNLAALVTATFSLVGATAVLLARARPHATARISTP